MFSSLLSGAKLKNARENQNEERLVVRIPQTNTIRRLAQEQPTPPEDDSRVAPLSRAEIRSKRIRKQKTDRQHAQLLRLLLEDRFPRLSVASGEDRDLRQLLWHRHRMVQTRTRLINQLQEGDGRLPRWPWPVDLESACTGCGARDGITSSGKRSVRTVDSPNIAVVCSSCW
jgi:hypothetical protein